MGKVKVFIEGVRSSREVAILNVHDIGCDHSTYMEFANHPTTKRISQKTVWIFVDLPGQSQDSGDLPEGFIMPQMHEIADDLVTILTELKVQQVVVFGEGAGANILARFAIAHPDRVFGAFLINCTTSRGSVFDNLQDKIKRKLSTNSASLQEEFISQHRFGSTHHKIQRNGSGDEQALIRNGTSIENNRKAFIESFNRRTSISEKSYILCPVVLMTSEGSQFRKATRLFHQSLLKTCDKTKIEFVDVSGVANVIEEQPDKVAETFLYFLQGLGVVSSVPMNNVVKLGATRGRSMSMQEYDEPKLNRRTRLTSEHGRFSVTGPHPEISSDPDSPASPSTPTHSPYGSPPHKVILETIDESGHAQLLKAVES